MIKAREEFAELQKITPARRFICIDESNAKTNIARLYGRSEKGFRCICGVKGSYKSVTMLSAIWSDGKTESLVFEGATDKAMFEAYIEKCLLPELKDWDIVVMDNLSSHKSAKIIELIESKKAKTLYLPPYSPDLNPIEMMWSKIKAYLKDAVTDTLDQLYESIKVAFESVTKDDAKGWYKHAGYMT